MFRIIKRRDIIRGVSARWNEQYPNEYAFGDGSTSSDTKKALAKLDLETCSPEDVAKVIGNNSWTRLECSACEQDVDLVLRIGDAPGYETRWVDLCRECFGKAAAVIGAIK